MRVEKVLVTGAAGGIGTALIPSLVETFQVVAFDDLSSGRWSSVHVDPRVQKIEGGVHNADDLSLVPWNEISAIVHLAAVSSLPACQANPAKAFHINFVGTSLLAHFARKNGISKFINASTSAIYEGVHEHFVETLHASPHLVYSQSKYFAELMLHSLWRDYSFPSVSLRLFNVFGPYQDYRRTSPPLVNYLVREFLNRRSPVLHSDGEQRRDYIYVGDVVRAITTVLDSDYYEYGCFNICSGTSFSVAEIVSTVASVLGVEMNPIYRNPALLWDMYEELFEGPYPLRSFVVNDETTKSSMGTAELFRSQFDWTISEEVTQQLRKVVQQTADFITEDSDLSA